jgi:hypothetical protein
MRAFGDQHHLARLAAGLVRGADAQQAAQLAVRTGLGRHRDAGMPVSDQPVRQLVHHFERAAHGLLRGERVDIGKAGQPRHLLVEARIVLHRARTERERARSMA